MRDRSYLPYQDFFNEGGPECIAMIFDNGTQANTAVEEVANIEKPNWSGRHVISILSPLFQCNSTQIILLIYRFINTKQCQTHCSNY